MDIESDHVYWRLGGQVPILDSRRKIVPKFIISHTVQLHEGEEIRIGGRELFINYFISPSVSYLFIFSFKVAFLTELCTFSPFLIKHRDFAQQFNLMTFYSSFCDSIPKPSYNDEVEKTFTNLSRFSTKNHLS